MARSPDTTASTSRTLTRETRYLPATQPGGPTLVFLHEALGSITQWRDFPEVLCAQTGCAGLVYARAGHGRSAAPPPVPRDMDYHRHDAWHELPALLADLTITGPCYLVGHSDGATIALLHAARAKPIGVTAMAPHVVPEPETLAGIREAGSRRAQLVPALGRHHDWPAQVFDAWHDTWLAPAFAQWNVEADLAGIRCPVLLIQGTDDQYGTLDQLVRIERAIHAGDPATPVTQLALDRAGHLPWKEQAEATRQAIAQHVALCCAR